MHASIPASIRSLTWCRPYLYRSRPSSPTYVANHNLSTTTSHLKKSTSLPPRPILPDADIKHVYLKGSGPGGQKINKTSSAVQLTHLPTGIVVKSQATRSQSQNHTIARRILAEKIELLEKGGESRAAKKIERAQRKKASAGKKTRRKYRKIEEEKTTTTTTGEEGAGVGSGDVALAAGAVGTQVEAGAGLGNRIAQRDQAVEDEEDSDEEWIDDDNYEREEGFESEDDIQVEFIDEPVQNQVHSPPSSGADPANERRQEQHPKG